MRGISHGITASAALALLLLAGPARGQSGRDFNLEWNTVAGGGVSVSSGGDYTLGGTIGQPAAATLSGGAFLLSGGFWQGVAMGQLLDAPPPTPAAAVFALRGFTENPARASRLAVTFSLAHDAPAQLELLDVAGRRVASREAGALGAGMHTLELADDATGIRPGVYFVRLAQGDHTIVRKGVVVR